jgi:hypothetical protein
MYNCKNKDFIYELSLRHYNLINSNNEFKQLKNDIVGELIFTNKINYNNGCVSVLNKNDLNKLRFDTEKWKRMSNEINSQIETKNNICCYRSIRLGTNINLVKDMVFPHPIPSSATFSIKMAKDWLKGDKCCLLQINIPAGTKFTILDKIGDKDSELILPPGDIIFRKKENQILICDFSPKEYILDNNACIPFDTKHLNKPLSKGGWKPKFRQ